MRLLGCASIGVCVYWGVHLLGCASIGVCVCWGVRLLGCASIGMCIYWDVHLLGYVSLASQLYFSACACALGRGEGEGRKNTSGDYSTVFVSPAGICGIPMKLQQPCDIAERYVTCMHTTRSEVREMTDQSSSTQEQIQAAITATGTLRYSALRPRQTKVVELTLSALLHQHKKPSL